MTAWFNPNHGWVKNGEYKYIMAARSHHLTRLGQEVEIGAPDEVTFAAQ